MDVRDALQQLPEPDPAAADRVWARVQRSRTRARRAWVLPVGLCLAAAAAMTVALRVEPHRTLQVDATLSADAWSAQVAFDFDGIGTVEGTPRDVEVAWASGTLRAEVEPRSGTHLAIVTEEARVEVVGTVFSVTRDRLGATTTVERGQVRVTCTDGWAGDVTPETGPHTCLPVGAVQLLSRADALADGGGDPDAVLQALDAGLTASAPNSTVRGEILVRRMGVHGASGRTRQALADADAYLAGPSPRADEVHRYAGWLARGADDCASALPHLEALERSGTPADRVLLAECLAPTDPARSRALLDAALPSLDAEWSARARRDLAVVEAR